MTEFEFNQQIRKQKQECSMLLLCVDECGYYNVWVKEAVEIPETRFVQKFGAKDGHFYMFKGLKRFEKFAKNYPDWETDF